MSYIRFDKTQLINLSYSLDKEIVRSNKSGAYASTTIIGCNTRKYHGLLVAPQEKLGGVHVLLSSLDETIVEGDQVFRLAIHKYPGKYEPRGHKYLRDFITDPMPRLEYRVGNIVLTKERLLVEHENRILIRYTLEEAQNPVRLQLTPFLAFRNIHDLSKANTYINKKFSPVNNGITLSLYEGYDDLFMQLSSDNEFVPSPDWYYNIEYPRDQENGQPFQEDLYVPGFFEVSMKKGESIIFTGGTDETKPQNLLRTFNSQSRKRTPRNSFENCLRVAAKQFVLRRKTKQGKEKTDIIAGYHWYERAGRDSFIALPGIAMAAEDPKLYKNVLATMLSERKGPLFPYWGGYEVQNFESIDAPLWFFWTLQQYNKLIDNPSQIWKTYGSHMVDILEGFRDGTDYNIHMANNHLIYGGDETTALTWMDARVEGQAVTPRHGMPVEVNALWYNAICFALEIAGPRSNLGKKFIAEWNDYPEKIRHAFIDTYWDSEKGYLADCVRENEQDWSVRPNMLLAASLPYSPLEEFMKESVLEVVKQELLTPRGLRSLSPKSSLYQGLFYGDLHARSRAFHQGSVWPWMLSHFIEAYLAIHRRSGLSFVKDILGQLEEVMLEHGISTVSEVYNGDPPHRPGGTISQAWNVAEILRTIDHVKTFEEITEPISI